MFYYDGLYPSGHLARHGPTLFLQLCRTHTHASYMLSLSSRILLHSLRRRSRWFIRRSKITLIERAHLIQLECVNDGMQHAKPDEVLFLPAVRVHRLSDAARGS